MPFDVHRLDNLSDEFIEDELADYIEAAVSAFDASPEGKAFATEYPEAGGWISSFIELGYNYEGRSLPAMNERTVAQMMESLLPRKITVMDASEAEEAIPELVAFWSFISREYQLPTAEKIVHYLQSIAGKFGEWMMDPARGGMAKNFILSGMDAGYDMTSEAGLKSYQQAYNAQLLGKPAKRSWKQKVTSLFGAASSSDEAVPTLPPKPAKKNTETNSKGFGAAIKSKGSRRKQR